MSPEEIEKKTQEVWDTLNSKKFSQTDIFLGIYFELNPGIKNQELHDRKKWEKERKYARVTISKPGSVKFEENHARKFFDFCKDSLSVDFKTIFPKTEKKRAFEFPAYYAAAISELLYEYIGNKITDITYVGKLKRKEYDAINNDDIKKFITSYAKRLEKIFEKEITAEKAAPCEISITTAIETLKESLEKAIEVRTQISAKKEECIKLIKKTFDSMLITEDLFAIPFYGLNARNNDASDVQNHESEKSDIYLDDLELLFEKASEVPSVCDKQSYKKTEYSVMSNLHAETSAQMAGLYKEYLNILKLAEARSIRNGIAYFENLVRRMSDDEEDLENIALCEQSEIETISSRMVKILLNEKENICSPYTEILNYLLSDKKD
jgi:hypothetical protein